MSREMARLEQAINGIKALQLEFWQTIKVTSIDQGLNQTLERADRVADFIELGTLMCKDTLNR